MKYVNFFWLIFCLLGGHFLAAQTLRGTVNGNDNNRPVANAVISFRWSGDGVRATSSGADGKYRLDSLPIVTGVLTISHPDFLPFSLSEVRITAGKERIVPAQLLPPMQEAAVAPVDIVASRPLRRVQPLGEIALSREQTLYYPNTYFDPARLAMASAGVAQTDDGTNAMSIRGNNPSYLKWRLQGIEIVNPNHLPNAGTLGDLPTSASGGVLMLSAQMLDNSALITGSGPEGYNGAIGGTMDLYLRKGNDQRHEQTIQAGLTGIDIAAEGPLTRKRKGSSYLVNYRYSTVGLLGKLGVSFGGEIISFQDIAAHVWLKGRKRNSWSLYALGGSSRNDYAPPDSATVFKALFDINYRSNTSIYGISHQGYAGRNFSIKTTLSVSKQHNSRQQDLSIPDPDSPLRSASFRADDNRLSFGSTLRGKIRPSFWWNGGFNYVYSDYNVENVVDPSLDFYNSFWYQTSFEPAVQVWLNGEKSFKDGNIKVIAGFNPMFTSHIISPDPSISVDIRMKHRQQLHFSISSLTQLNPPSIAFSWNNSSRYMQSVILNARYIWNPSDSWLWSAEVFNQEIYGIAVNGARADGFSAYNVTDPFLGNNFTSQNDGQAHNYGIEFTALKKLSRGWFMNANSTLLRSEYKGSDNITRRSRWDAGYIANLTVGKEWSRKIKKNQSGRVFGLNGRIVLMGGQRTQAIDLNASAAQASTVYSTDAGLTGQNPAYFRVDGRVYWKKSIRNWRNSTFALEFQNLSGQKNMAYRYYDPLLRQEQIKYQLGLIPNLSWRLEL